MDNGIPTNDHQPTPGRLSGCTCLVVNVLGTVMAPITGGLALGTAFVTGGAVLARAFKGEL